MAEAAPSVEPRRRGAGKSASAFRTISEVAGELEVPQHVLRFWESKFIQVRPMKRGGGRRYYRPEDIDLLRSIRELLYTDGYTIKGVQKLLREGGVKALAERQIPERPAIEPTPIDRAEPVVAARPAPAPAVAAEASETAALKAALAEVLDELERIKRRLRDALE
ncbi:MAG: MerR family transcriptional regulator [Defluviicoccus sp.]|nr:MerR family transcriptional regulator [Defluviicoccus sp.]MDE0383155.1 MerR family transcriptional regulator [Defluviicoccus sp.]